MGAGLSELERLLRGAWDRPPLGRNRNPAGDKSLTSGASRRIRCSSAQSSRRSGERGRCALLPHAGSHIPVVNLDREKRPWAALASAKRAMNLRIYARGFCAKASSLARSVLPSISSSLDGMIGLINGSLRSRGAKSEVVVRNPFEAPSPCSTPIKALTSSAVTRWPGLYALT